MPDEPDRRNERLDKAAARPTPEHRKPLPSKLHKVETAAATAAAILGTIFSSSPGILLGAGGSIDENVLFDPQASSRPRGARGEGPEKEAPEPEPVDPTQLVPWVRLGPSEAK